MFDADEVCFFGYAFNFICSGGKDAMEVAITDDYAGRSNILLKSFCIAMIAILILNVFKYFAKMSS
jgi:hypothetical protein